MSSTEFKLNYQKKELPSSLTKLGVTFFVIGLLLVLLTFFVDSVRGSFNFLMLLMFMISIGVGALFLVAVEYISGAVWSTPIRRITEIFSAVILVLPILAIPVYFNMHGMYHWTHTEDVVADKLLTHKEPYLNMSFFTIRAVVVFVIWILFYFLLTKNSLKQDETKDQNLTKKNIRLSAIFLPFFAITLTVASIDWMMSLEPHWFSTIFGIYYFSGTVLAALAVVTFTFILLVEKGYLLDSFVKDHYYSLGALLFAFTNFWAYIAFSQFLLIWYANIPEETFWFIHRMEGSWAIVSLLQIVIHFAVPYFVLLSQPSKMDPKKLKFAALWILFAHIFDLYWLIMPTLGKNEIVFGWMELGFPLLTIGMLILIFKYFAKNKNLIPIGDPKLKRGIDFRL